jgi:hypothetical protein
MKPSFNELMKEGRKTTYFNWDKIIKSSLGFAFLVKGVWILLR